MDNHVGARARIGRARRRLAEHGPPSERAPADFEVVSLPATDCDVLRDLLIDEGARMVVEVGLAYGSSTLAIGEALVAGGHGGRLVVIDAFQDQFGRAGLAAIAEAGLDETCRVELDRSQLVLARLVGEGMRADAAFVDGSHIFHNVFVDLYYLRDIVDPGGLIVLDDCGWPSVATAVDYFVTNTGWRPESVPEGTRLRAFRLPDSRVDPAFTDFVAFGRDVGG